MASDWRVWRGVGVATVLWGLTMLAIATGPAFAVGVPDGRAYEKITPSEKNGGNAFAGIVMDGNHTYFPVGASFLPDDPYVSSAAYYVATRGDTTWNLRPGWQGASTDIVDFNTAFTQDTIEGPAPLLPAIDNDIFRDVYARDGKGLRLISQGSLGNSPDDAYFAGQSDDGTHIAFETISHLEPEDAGRVVGNQLYERVGTETHVVGVDSNEQPLNDSGAVLGDGAVNFLVPPSGSSNAISADGSRIFFESPDPFTFQNTQLYVRINAEDTIHVSASQCKRVAPDPPCGDPQPVTFQGAAKDGSKVFFTTTGQLVDEDLDVSIDLYAYDLNSGELTRLSGGNDGTVQDADVRGVTKVSQDGRRVYFLAAGPVAPGGSPGVPALYLFDGADNSITFVASVGNAVLWEQGLQVPLYAASGTPDGSVLVFESPDNLTSFDSGGALQVYRYDANAHSLICVSCNSKGLPPMSKDSESGQIHRSRGPNTPLFFPGTAGAGSTISQLVSDDGSRVVFQSFDALVDEDTNNRGDVYQWHNGTVSLISTGTSSVDSRLAGISADGHDIFFVTTDRLVTDDTDALADLYDARVGGGLPQSSGPAPDCDVNTCRPGQTAPPQLPDAGSTTFLGAGDVVQAKRAKFVVGKVSSGQRVTLARRGKITLRVGVNRAGRIVATTRARLGRRTVSSSRAAKVAREAGAVEIPVNLSRAGRRALQRHGKLTVSVSIRFAGAPEPSVITMKLRRTTGGKGR